MRLSEYLIEKNRERYLEEEKIRKKIADSEYKEAARKLKQRFPVWDVERLDYERVVIRIDDIYTEYRNHKFVLIKQCDRCNKWFDVSSEIIDPDNFAGWIDLYKLIRRCR